MLKWYVKNFHPWLLNSPNFMSLGLYILVHWIKAIGKTSEAQPGVLRSSEVYSWY